MAETIPLRDAIRALRVEIVEAAEEASTQAVRFELGPVELEFHVVAKTEKSSDAKLSAKIGFHILSAEAGVSNGGKSADERTQRVKLVLNPVLVNIAGLRSKLEIGRSEARSRKQAPKRTLDRS
jgi:hypothetical protein